MDDTTRILIEGLGLAVLIADAACYALFIRKKRVRSSDTRFIGGVITGFVIVEEPGFCSQNSTGILMQRRWDSSGDLLQGYGLDLSLPFPILPDTNFFQ